MSEFIPDPDDDLEHTGYSILFEEDELILCWANSRIRTFRDQQFNHIEYVDDVGRLKGIIMPANTLAHLIDVGFPLSYDPYVDRETEEWFVAMATRDLATLEPEAFND